MDTIQKLNKNWTSLLVFWIFCRHPDPISELVPKVDPLLVNKCTKAGYCSKMAIQHYLTENIFITLLMAQWVDLEAKSRTERMAVRDHPMGCCNWTYPTLEPTLEQFYPNRLNSELELKMWLFLFSRRLWNFSREEKNSIRANYLAEASNNSRMCWSQPDLSRSAHHLSDLFFDRA